MPRRPGWEENRFELIWTAEAKYDALTPELQEDLDSYLGTLSKSPTLPSENQVIEARGQGNEISYIALVGLWEVYYYLELFEGEIVMFVADFYHLRDLLPSLYRAWF